MNFYVCKVSSKYQLKSCTCSLFIYFGAFSIQNYCFGLFFFPNKLIQFIGFPLLLYAKEACSMSSQNFWGVICVVNKHMDMDLNFLCQPHSHVDMVYN